MLNQENREKCRRVLNRFGYRHQALILVEECAELQQAVCKLFRSETTLMSQSENFKEEIVDVIVMVTQAVMMSGLSAEEINRRAKDKLDKLAR